MSWSCATPRTFDCATLSIIGHALPLSTITRAALATPRCADAGTHTDAPSAVSQTDSLQWRASSCNDRPCLTLISARPPHHKAAPFVPSRRPMFLSSTTRPFLRPDLPDSTAPRTEAVKTGRRPPPQAAQCGLDGREHGATLNQVDGARFLSRHTIRKGWLTDLLPAGLTARCFFACHNGRKSHHQLSRSRRVLRTADVGQLRQNGAPGATGSKAPLPAVCRGEVPPTGSTNSRP